MNLKISRVWIHQKSIDFSYNSEETYTASPKGLDQKQYRFIYIVFGLDPFCIITICPSDPFYTCLYYRLYKLGNYFLVIQYNI